MAHCISCNCETNKYKCSTCLASYCSLPCYKKHMEAPCTQENTNDNSNQSVKIEPKPQMPFKTDDTVDTERLEALEHSEELRNLLYNPHLRNFLKEVDSAPDAWKAIKAAMQEPLFLEFADACLKVVEPPAADEIVGTEGEA